MKKVVTLIAIAGIAITMANCSSGKSTTASSGNNEMTPAAKVAEVRKNYTAQQLEEGKTLMTQNCQKCHGLKSPETRTVEKLEQVLPSMINKAKLTEQQGQLVRAYMIAHAKAS